MAKKQFYGIKYPFIAQDEENYFVDLNKDIKSKIQSLLIHVVFTPKGQKIRDPEFGTDLIQFIFNPNDMDTWDGIKEEVKKVVSKYIKGITINEILILPSNDERHDIYVRLDYSIMKNGINKETDSLIIKV